MQKTANNESYDEWHKRLAERERARHNEAATGIWYDMVRPRLGDISGISVLEVGCGRGSFAIELARMGGNVTGLDISAAAIDTARERARDAGVEVRFVVADAASTGLTAMSYDLVVSCECLEHVEKPRAVVAELFRLCKPGARCIVTTPSYLNGALIGWLHSWITARPYNSGEGVQPRENFFLYIGVRKMLRSGGFRIIEEDSRLFRWLLLPGVAPEKLQTVAFRSPLLNRLARPFGLHFMYSLVRPAVA